MATTRYQTVTNIINQVAVESGLGPFVDVLASSDPAFVQLRYLLNSSLAELMEMHPWEGLTREFSYTTTVGEEGKIDLPADFGYMIDQTGWDRSNNLPLAGPLSPQEWTFLLGRNLEAAPRYVSFRFDSGQFWVLPQSPMPPNVEITFEYISRNLVQSAGILPYEYSDVVETSGDIVLLPPQVVTRLLKLRFLEAKGFDATAASAQFTNAFNSWTGKSVSAPILSAGRGGTGVALLNKLLNVPASGYGQ
jgi:hypothetical protein